MQRIVCVIVRGLPAASACRFGCWWGFPRQVSGTAVPHAPHTLTPLQGRGRGCGPEILYVPRHAGLFHHGSIRRDVFPLSGHFCQLLNPWYRIASLSSRPLLALVNLVRWLLTIGLSPAHKNVCLC